MLSLLVAVIVLCAVVPFFLLQRRAARESQRKVEATLAAAFARCVFDTPEGPVDGSALRVVKISWQTSRTAATQVNVPTLIPMPGDVFGYCVGPGPSYFLAIGVFYPGNGEVRAEWVLRPLTEPRMRAALTGDAEATARTFGPAGAA